MFTLSFELAKWNFTTVGPLWKNPLAIPWKKTLFPPWKKSFRNPPIYTAPPSAGSAIVSPQVSKNTRFKRYTRWGQVSRELRKFPRFEIMTPSLLCNQLTHPCVSIGAHDGGNSRFRGTTFAAGVAAFLTALFAPFADFCRFFPSDFFFSADAASSGSTNQRLWSNWVKRKKLFNRGASHRFGQSNFREKFASHSFPVSCHPRGRCHEWETHTLEQLNHATYKSIGDAQTSFLISCWYL